MNAAREEAERLLRLARRDQRAFDNLLATAEAEDFPSAAFHAQQAVEKSLKAALCLAGVELRRTHDLLELAGDIEAAGMILPVANDDLLRLTPYAVEFRYDDQALPLITPAIAKSVVERCLVWCEARISTSAP